MHRGCMFVFVPLHYYTYLSTPFFPLIYSPFQKLTIPVHYKFYLQSITDISFGSAVLQQRAEN